MNQPHNLDYEKILLSSLILDPNSYHDVAGMLTTDCFYATYHQQVYRAISCLVAEEKPVTVISVAAEMQRQGIEPKRSELVSIAGASATAGNIDYYAKTVSELYVRRKTIASFVTWSELLGDLTSDVDEVVATAHKELDHVNPAAGIAESNVYPAIINTWERLLDIKHGGALNYVPTGFIDLDNLVNFSNGTLTIIGASPRVGKTSFVLCVMRHVAKSGKRPLLFTLEMTRDRIMENLIAQEAKVCHRDMILGRLSESDESKISRMAGLWAKYQLGVLEGRWGVTQIRHRVMKEIRDFGVDILFIDSLGKLQAPEGVKQDSLHRVISGNTQLLQDLAIELNIPVVVTHHLNRDKAKDDSKPTLFSLRESGEEYCDGVILMYRAYLHKPTPANKHVSEFIIAKNRDGDVDTVELGWDGPTKSFYNLANRKETPEVMKGAYQ